MSFVGWWCFDGSVLVALCHVGQLFGVSLDHLVVTNWKVGGYENMDEVANKELE
jgi:hypothetical protein